MKRKYLLSLVFSLLFVVSAALGLGGCGSTDTTKATFNELAWKNALTLRSSDTFTVTTSGYMYDEKDGTALYSFNQEILVTDTACKFYQNSVDLSTGEAYVNHTAYYDLDCGYWYMYELQEDGTYREVKLNSSSSMMPYSWVYDNIQKYTSYYKQFRKNGDHYNYSASNGSINIYFNKITRWVEYDGGRNVSETFVSKMEKSIPVSYPDNPDVTYEITSTEIKNIGTTTVTFPENVVPDRHEYYGGYVTINCIAHEYHEGIYLEAEYEDLKNPIGERPLVYVTKDNIIFGANGDKDIVTLPYTVTRNGNRYNFNVESDVYSDIEFIPGAAKEAEGGLFPNLKLYSGYGRSIRAYSSSGMNDTLRYKVNGQQYYAVVGDFYDVNIVAEKVGEDDYSPIMLIYYYHVSSGSYKYPQFLSKDKLILINYTEYKEDESQVRDFDTQTNIMRPRIFFADKIIICNLKSYSVIDEEHDTGFSYNAETGTYTSTRSDIRFDCTGGEDLFENEEYASGYYFNIYGHFYADGYSGNMSAKFDVQFKSQDGIITYLELLTETITNIRYYVYPY